MGLTKVYDSGSIVCTFDGILLTGFAPGSRVKVAFPDAFTKQVGSDGEVCRSRTNDNTATVTFTLMQTSFSNDALSALHNVDKATPFGAGVGPLMIRDLNGASLFSAPQAWITKNADSEYAQESGNREWTIETGDMNALVGGNNVA
jgi:hypothetical protein